MSQAAIFTLKLEPELRAEFMAEAEARHRPASQVVRELMRDFVQQQRDQRAHSAFLQNKVDAAHMSASAGRGRSNEAVEAEFVALARGYRSGLNIVWTPEAEQDRAASMGLSCG